MEALQVPPPSLSTPTPPRFFFSLLARCGFLPNAPRLGTNRRHGGSKLRGHTVARRLGQWPDEAAASMGACIEGRKPNTASQRPHPYKGPRATSSALFSPGPRPSRLAAATRALFAVMRVRRLAISRAETRTCPRCLLPEHRAQLSPPRGRHRLRPVLRVRGRARRVQTTQRLRMAIPRTKGDERPSALRDRG